MALSSTRRVGPLRAIFLRGRVVDGFDGDVAHDIVDRIVLRCTGGRFIGPEPRVVVLIEVEHAEVRFADRYISVRSW